MDIMKSIWQRAKADPQKVAFPEATEEKILLTARECADKGICKPMLVGAASRTSRKQLRSMAFHWKASNW